MQAVQDGRHFLDLVDVPIFDNFQGDFSQAMGHSADAVADEVLQRVLKGVVEEYTSVNSRAK